MSSGRHIFDYASEEQNNIKNCAISSGTCEAKAQATRRVYVLWVSRSEMQQFITETPLKRGESAPMDIVGLLISIVVGIIVVAPVLWLVGRALVGKEKAKFTDATWIVTLGIVIGAIVGAFIGGIIASIIMFIVWLALIKHFFDCGWLMAFAIAVVSVIIFIVIVAVLALLGIAVIGLGLGLAL